MRFREELQKGNFCMTVCTKCSNIVWPPSKYCNICFGITNLRKSNKYGKIIEFSWKDGQCFCVGEFENKVRIMGSLFSKKPTVGEKIKIQKCGIRNNSYYFEFITESSKTE